MDRTKNPLAVVTMVYGDYFFLKRWYDYYKNQVGVENLYIFSHGNDMRHREIAEGANVISLPRDKTMFRFDRRRWRMLSSFVSSMLQFYNWVILSDVDEIVIVDPKAASGILEYLQAHYWDQDTAPKNIAPLCLEIVHYPDDETLPIVDSETILSRRRTYRPNQNYSKPCLVRSEVKFKAGGHLNNLSRRHMPSDMYMLHLKYFDFRVTEDRSQERVEKILGPGDLNENYSNMDSWYETHRFHERILQNLSFAGEELELVDFRAKMAQQQDRGRNRFSYGRAKSKHLYRMPERFSKVF